MKHLLQFLLFIITLLVIVYLAGPRYPKPKLSLDLPSIPADVAALEKQILEIEKSQKLKPDNQARFLWANDSVKERTDFSLLYLHGFSACWYEGYPVNADFARHFGCNAYFARLASHAIDTTDALLDMTPDKLWESAKKALVIANRIGRKVIIMSTSTGGTLALKLAAEFPDYVHALILYSPNVRINNNLAFLVSKPWGINIARMSAKSKYRVTNPDSSSQECKYWDCRYRLESVVYLQLLLEATMVEETFKRVTKPVFLGYYFKDEEHQDKTVRVDAALRMFDQLGTPEEKKIKTAFPEAGDHVIAGELFSRSVDQVRKATFDFAEEILGMKAD